VIPLNVCNIKESIEKNLETQKTLLNLESIQDDSLKDIRKTHTDLESHLEMLEKQKINISE
jgi:hypothetical protein